MRAPAGVRLLARGAAPEARGCWLWPFEARGKALGTRREKVRPPAGKKFYHKLGPMDNPTSAYFDMTTANSSRLKTAPSAGMRGKGTQRHVWTLSFALLTVVPEYKPRRHRRRLSDRRAKCHLWHAKGRRQEAVSPKVGE